MACRKNFGNTIVRIGNVIKCRSNEQIKMFVLRFKRGDARNDII